MPPPFADGADPLLDQLAGARGLYGNTAEPGRPRDLNLAALGGVGVQLDALLRSLGVPSDLGGIMGQYGMMPTPFAGGRNLYDHQQDKAYWASRAAAVRLGAESDRDTYVQMLRGIAQMRGTPWGLEQQRSANVIAGDVASLAPYLAEMMPDLFDSMHGTRGSAAVLARGLARGGRFAVDPATGREGMSAASIGEVTREIQDRYFAPGRDISGFRGIGMGQLGSLYEELQNRGLAGWSIGTYADPAEQLARVAGDREGREGFVRRLQEERPAEFARLRDRAERERPGIALAGLAPDEQVRRIADAERSTTDAIKVIQQSEPGRFETLLRQFDAGAIARRVKDLSGAVGAMREIFGDMGRPNAPMGELIEGLNALTQGGLATMSPNEVERTVRMTRVLAKQTGMGLEAMAGLTAQGAAAADSLGLDRQFAVRATQGAAAFGAAFGQVGRGDIAAWGRADRDRLTLLDQQARLRAAGSDAANNLGAAMRIADAADAAGLPTAPGLRALATAVRNREDTFAPDPSRPDARRSIVMDEQQMREFLTAQGVQPGMAQQFLRARGANQPQIARYGIDNVVRDKQGQVDIEPFVAKQFQATAQAALADSARAAGVTLAPADARRTAEAVGRAQAAALTTMDPEVRLRDPARNKALGDVARRVVAASVDPAIAARFQGEMQAEAGWGVLDDARASSPAFRGFPGNHSMYDLNNPAIAGRRAAIERRAGATAMMQSAMAGLGQSGPMQRIMDMVQSPPADLPTAIGRALGGASPADVRARIAAIPTGDAYALADIPARDRVGVMMQEFLAAVRQFERIDADPNLAPEQRAARQQLASRRAAALRSGGAAATAQIRDELAAAGALAPGGDLGAALATMRSDPRAFPGLAPEGRSAVEALLAAGGGVDAEKGTADLLKGAGYTQADLPKILAGALPMAAPELARLRSLQGLGIDAAGPQAGIAVGAAVGPKQVGDALMQGRLLEQDVGGRLASPRKLAGAELDAARRHAENAVGRGERVVDAMLGSPETILALGAGGFATTREIREQQKALTLRAHQLNVSPAEALLRGDPAAVEAYSKARAGLGELQARMADPAKQPLMQAAEVQAYNAYRAEETKGDEQRNSEAIEKALAGADPGLFTPARQKEAAQLLGEGVEGDTHRRRLDLAVQSARKVRDLAAARGVDYAALRAAATTPGGLGLSDQVRQDLSDDLRQAGPLGEGVTPDNLQQLLKQLAKPDPAAGRDPNAPQHVVVRGKLDLQNGEITADGESTTPFDATPVMV